MEVKVLPSLSPPVVEDLEKQEAKIRNTKEQQNVGLVDMYEEDNFVMREFWAANACPGCSFTFLAVPV